MNIFELMRFQMSLLIALTFTKEYQVFQSIVLINIIFLIIDDDIYASLLKIQKY